MVFHIVQIIYGFDTPDLVFLNFHEQNGFLNVYKLQLKIEEEINDDKIRVWAMMMGMNIIIFFHRIGK